MSATRSVGHLNKTYMGRPSTGKPKLSLQLATQITDGGFCTPVQQHSFHLRLHPPQILSISSARIVSRTSKKRKHSKLFHHGNRTWEDRLGKMELASTFDKLGQDFS
ncbi:hypothetical protein JTE90_021263 [Oedothorax gibbosus]|uniref:Uncharacterized protein n=1 Tax=Oedothorax gibbosus TaxID=931172 RepID=A0AAV6U164_9ARAC|nr:hypothetical protein JTE90_021263 [Oedothorax gibbosus]